MDTDIDSYSVLHYHCADSVQQEANERFAAIEQGHTNIPNMTQVEREIALAVRRDQRAAVADPQR